MAAVLTLRSKVLAGNRVEFIVPELPEGSEVEIVVALANAPATGRRRSVLGIIDARPPSQLTSQDWQRIDRELQEDRDSWDR